MPNPRVCDCTCVLTRIDHCLMNNSIMMFALELMWHAFRYQFIRSIQNRNDKLQVQQLYTDINSFVASKTVTINYRYSSFTLRAYLCWRHTYCKWPIIELAKNVSPKNKMAASHAVQIDTHARFPRSKSTVTLAAHARRGLINHQESTMNETNKLDRLCTHKQQRFLS